MTELLHDQYGQVLTIVLGLALVGLGLLALIGIVRRPEVTSYRAVWMKFAIHMWIMTFLVTAGAFGRWAVLPVALYLAYFGWRELLQGLSVRFGDLPYANWLPVLGMAGIPFGMGSHAWELLSGGLLTGWLVLTVPMLAARRPPALTLMLAAGLGTLLITLPLTLLLFTDLSYPHFAFLILVIMAHDGFSEGLGRLGGKTAIWPHISPNKTVMGSVGGLAGCLAIALSARVLLVDWPLAQVVLVAGLIAIVGSLGDLVASSIKREAGIKDFSQLIPYHGGVLDRFDSLLFATPMFLVLSRWIGAS